MTQVAIIGAGIGGLTLYHALRQRGIAAALYEAAPVFQEVGTGISIPSNGMQVLARLGLADEVLRRGWPLARFEICDALAGVIQTTECAPYERQYGFGIVGIHRAALHEVLTAGVAPADLHLGWE
jgi:2-polyprenyl-6-methoxyphenol hydroxylase-like FAD-dependent oxidoreductase